MCDLQTVNADSVYASIDINDKVFLCAANHSVGAIIWWLRGFSNGVAANENMGTGMQLFGNMN